MKKKADVIKPHKIKDVDQQLGFNAFPYTSLLSFAPLITYWKKKCNSRDRGEAILAKEIITQLDGALELQQPVRDPTQLIHHRDFINLLMSGIFPLAQRNQQMAQATKGFSLEGFYQTNRLRKFLKTNRLNIVNNKDPERVRQDAIIRAGCMILNAFYGQQFPLKDPYIFSARSEDTLVETHYKAALNLDFFEIKKKLGLPAISQEQIFELISNFDRPDLWLERLPPSHFEFHGLITVQFIDITEEEAISRLRQFLLQKDSVLEGQSIAKMEELLASYFNIPGMRLGLTEFSYPETKMANQSLSLRHHILGNSYSSLKGLGFAGSIYEQVCQSKEATIFEDIDKIERKSPLELALLEEGIHSIYVAPLQGKDGTIFALLEFGAPAAYALNSFSKIKINEIQPLFRTAFSRKIEELNNEVSALIRQRFTNIHPTVEWRFLEEATRLLRAKKMGLPDIEHKPIIFKEIYPLYGQSDIVSSTVNRNKAIQKDFVEQFQRMLEVLRTISKFRKDKVNGPLKELIQETLSDYQENVTPDDEREAMTLIEADVHPYFKSVLLTHPTLTEAITNYFSGLNPQLNLVYKARKHYEQSVAKINKTIINCLIEKEDRLQKVLPHYFERYQTDGVEYDIYVGQSLLQQARFEVPHLETFRLWQLTTMCEITRKIAALQGELPIKLTTAQLILVHNMPLTIRFKMGEKKFDIDGDYNIRYAVLKKRIDKATVAGTGKRLTKSGKVAIVYTQDLDRQEYGRYLAYLLEKQLIEPDIEDFDLAPMQGVVGLKAIRVTVRIEK